MPLQASEMKRRRPTASLRRRAFRIAEHVFALIGVLAVVFHLFFELSVVVSGSMSPTLRGESVEEGDWVLAETITYGLRGPRRWELVAFHNSEGLPVMKRVAGLPGERVALKDGVVIANDTPVARPRSLEGVSYLACGRLRGGRNVSCGEGYFLLGDDSRDSWDSRFEGPVAPGRIDSRPLVRVWPPSRIGFVNP